MDKLERLLNLTLALLETPKPLTAHELQERVPGYPEGEVAFRRSFERDKESLREMGVRITRTEITHTDPPSEGYRIKPEDYYLRDPGFEPDELAAVNLAATAVRLDTAHGAEGLWKLGGPGTGEPAAGEPVVELPGDPNLGPLFGAAAERAPVTFTYNSTQRTLDPYRLDYQRGHWYVTGFDHVRGEERNFRVDRIEGAITTGRAHSFEPPTTAVPGGPAQPWQFGEGEPVIARLLVDAPQAPWVRQHLGEEAVEEERADGSIVFRVPVTAWPAFRSFVLTFLDHAELLEPPDLRDALIRWLEGFSRAEEQP